MHTSFARSHPSSAYAHRSGIVLCRETCLVRFRPYLLTLIASGQLYTLFVWSDTLQDFICDLPRTSLTELKHFAVEFIACRSVSPDAGIRTVPSSLIVSLLSLTRFTHLASLALRLSDQQPFPTTLVEDVVEMHGVHLRSVRFMGFTLDSQGIESLMECEGLEKLAISVPAEDIVSLPVLPTWASGWIHIAHSTRSHTRWRGPPLCIRSLMWSNTERMGSRCPSPRIASG